VLLLLSSMRHSRADSSFLLQRLSGASGTSRIAFLEAAVFFSPTASATAFFSVFSRRQRWFFRGGDCKPFSLYRLSSAICLLFKIT
jgi:hypothetical protein